MSRVHLVAAVVLAFGLAGVQPHAAGPATPQSCPVLQRFLSIEDATPTQFRALRHLEARNDKFDRTAWMDVWTEAVQGGAFQFTIVGQGGSDYIRDRVLLPAIETEKRLWGQRGTERSALNLTNYVFEDRGQDHDGLAALGVKPRRKDMLLVDGSIFVRPETGDLVRVEGQLVKPPSFWTRHVEIVRWYERIAGVRMPVAVESVANVLVAGRSTFRMTYEYETVNGQHVGTPQPRIAALVQHP